MGERRSKRNMKGRKKRPYWQRNMVKFRIPEGEVIDYKNISLLKRYLNDRGKIIPRRFSGVTAKEQRKLSLAIQRARFLSSVNIL